MTTEEKGGTHVLEHRESSESVGFYCWCIPTVERIQHDSDFSWLIIHNAGEN